MHLPVDGGDPVEVGLGHLDGADRLARERVGQLGRSGARQVGGVSRQLPSSQGVHEMMPYAAEPVAAAAYAVSLGGRHHAGRSTGGPISPRRGCAAPRSARCSCSGRAGQRLLGRRGSGAPRRGGSRWSAASGATSGRRPRSGACWTLATDSRMTASSPTMRSSSASESSMRARPARWATSSREREDMAGQSMGRTVRSRPRLGPHADHLRNGALDVCAPNRRVGSGTGSAPAGDDLLADQVACRAPDAVAEEQDDEHEDGTGDHARCR